MVASNVIGTGRSLTRQATETAASLTPIPFDGKF
jgi:hypothetical protein